MASRRAPAGHRAFATVRMNRDWGARCGLRRDDGPETHAGGPSGLVALPGQRHRRGGDEHMALRCALPTAVAIGLGPRALPRDLGRL